LRLKHLNGVQVVGGSNPPIPTKIHAVSLVIFPPEKSNAILDPDVDNLISLTYAGYFGGITNN
jgi:hypothetical protein